MKINYNYNVNGLLFPDRGHKGTGTLRVEKNISPEPLVQIDYKNFYQVLLIKKPEPEQLLFLTKKQ